MLLGGDAPAAVEEAPVQATAAAGESESAPAAAEDDSAPAPAAAGTRCYDLYRTDINSLIHKNFFYKLNSFPEPASGGGETELASPAGPANGTVPVVEGGYCGGFKSKACNII